VNGVVEGLQDLSIDKACDPDEGRTIWIVGWDCDIVFVEQQDDSVCSYKFFQGSYSHIAEAEQCRFQQSANPHRLTLREYRWLIETNIAHT
jgi:hypothetical protein